MPGPGPGGEGRGGEGGFASRNKPRCKLGQTGKHNAHIDYNYRSNQFEHQTAHLQFSHLILRVGEVRIDSVSHCYYATYHWPVMAQGLQ